MSDPRRYAFEDWTPADGARHLVGACDAGLVAAWHRQLRRLGTTPERRLAELAEIADRDPPPAARADAPGPDPVDERIADLRHPEARRLAADSAPSAPACVLRSRFACLDERPPGPWKQRLEGDTAATWATGLELVCARVDADAAAFGETFGVDAGGARDLEALHLAQGDPHGPAGGTMRLRLRGGRDLYYKPRPTAGDVGAARLNTRLARQVGGRWAVHLPTMLDRGTHLYQEAVEARRGTGSCPPDAVGHLIALGIQAGLTDLHGDNLRRLGAGIVILDAEGGPASGDLATGHPRRGVHPDIATLAAHPLLGSGLFGDPTVPAAFAGEERPGLAAVLDPGSTARDAIIAARRAVPVGPPDPERDPVRVVLRPTVWYQRCFRASLERRPGDGADSRLVHVDAGVLAASAAATAGAITAYETRSILAGWIPIFHLSPATGTLFGGVRPLATLRRATASWGSTDATDAVIAAGIDMLTAPDPLRAEAHRLRCLAAALPPATGSRRGPTEVPPASTSDPVGITRQAYLDWLAAQDAGAYAADGAVDRWWRTLLGRGAATLRHR